MHTIKSTTLLVVLCTLGLSLSSLAQVNPGYDPAVISRDISPAPIPGGVGAPFSLTFTIGNLGNSPISGADGANQMGFGICLRNSTPASGTANAAASLSGEILQYFDVTFTGTCFEGVQKPGVAVPPISFFDLTIQAVVTVASSSTAINEIGAFINIAPNATAVGQPTDNDFAAIYTHTTVTAMPVALVSFTAQAEADRTVLLNWSTSWERANKGYVIERSKDLKSFEAVGEVTDVAGTSNSLNTYRFVDAAPYRGTSYYRLRQVDLDGSSHIYKAEGVVIEGRYGVYPNPVVNDTFTLELDESATAVLHLYTTNGNELALDKKDSTAVSVQVTPSSKLSSGVYILTVEERGTIRKHRLVVK